MRLWPFEAAEAPRRPIWLTLRPYAHRGLHNDLRVENSRAAFEAAIAAGNGIELDVQATSCGSAFVLHDAELDRLCRRSGRLDAIAADEAATVALRGCDETLLSLREALELVDERVPVLIEVKSQPRMEAAEALCGSVRDELLYYRGPAAVMSFDPRIVEWFMIQAPEILRGLVVSEESGDLINGWWKRHLALKIARPDFLAYDIRSLPSRFAASQRRSGRPILAWTVRTLGETQRAARHADQIIHERS
jgi:glycerophosphoryl diester phosphodiesterase